METLVLLIFVAGLVLCIAAGASIIYAMLFGYALFFCYGLWKKRTVREMLKMSWQGVRTVKNIMIVFALIGAVTAVWRASGTVPMIVYSTARLILPSMFVLMSFLLSCAVSMLMGTAFGTAATVGVICMSIGGTMGVQPAYLGGAILAGAFFGDRCSPMSTSALLVSEITGTDIFGNIRAMLKTGALPFVLSCVVYIILGAGCGASGVTGAGEETLALFPECFSLHWLTLVPAAIIIVMSLFKVNVKWTMLASVLAACVICFALQHMPLPKLMWTMLAGYRAPDTRLSAVLDGGGIVSMLRVAAIVCISSSYSGIFAGTGLLDGLTGRVEKLSERTSPFCGALVTAIVTSMVACNQTLAIMLTAQLCGGSYDDRSKLALAIEDSAVVVSPLIPWSIAGAVPLTVVAAPEISLLAACYLYLLPLIELVKGQIKARDKRTRSV